MQGMGQHSWRTPGDRFKKLLTKKSDYFTFFNIRHVTNGFLLRLIDVKKQ